MTFFVIQLLIFVVLFIGIGIVSKLLGNNNLYFFLALLLLVTVFATVTNVGNLTDRYFIYIMLASTICIVSIIKLILKNT
jgi:hypothetical protein